MKPIMILFAWCATLSAVFAQSAPENTIAQQQILAVIHQQIDGWNSGSIESFMQGYAVSDSLRFASGGSITYGWKTMLERYKKGYPTRQKMGTLSFTNITIDSISTDAAVVFGTWRVKRDKDEPWGLFTLLFKKSADGWRIVHDHTSSGN
ncbi:MAG: nuclear transport factor 2 family protein [Bacteroidota bacterium]